VPTALETDSFDLRTHAYVTGIHHDGEKATGVRYVDMQTEEEYDQPADIVVLTSYTLNNARLLLNSDIGRPYDTNTQTGVIRNKYCYHITSCVTGLFKDKFNAAIGAFSFDSTLDDYYNDNFDHSDLDFIHGGSIT